MTDAFSALDERHCSGERLVGPSVHGRFLLPQRHSLSIVVETPLANPTNGHKVILHLEKYHFLCVSESTKQKSHWDSNSSVIVTKISDSSLSRS
jgi:hypothetical protein